MKKRVMSVELVRPPITARARGAWDSPERDQAEHGGEGVHQDRAQTAASGFADCDYQRELVAAAQEVCSVDEQDGVVHHDAGEHDAADEGLPMAARGTENMTMSGSIRDSNWHAMTM